MPAEIDSPIDGRRARRERGRLAATEAMVDLIFEGCAPPTAEQVAERAGVSVASLFRYFETLDDLRRETADFYFQKFSHLFAIPDAGTGALTKRIQDYVAARVKLYETTEPMSRLVRARAPEQAEVDELVRHTRATLASQIRHHFAPELRALTGAERDDLVAAICTLTSFESWDQIRHDHHRSPLQTRRAWSRAMHRLLEPAPDHRERSASHPSLDTLQ